jgi:hypothetical protein
MSKAKTDHQQANRPAKDKQGPIGRRFRMAVLTIRHTVASAESKSPRTSQ